MKTGIAYVVFAIALALWVGQDVNWDLRNYHLYNVFMLVENRFDRDVEVAGIQTFLNPILDLPVYAAIRARTPPVAINAALAAFHGLGLWLVHALTVLVLAREPKWFAYAAGVCAAVMAGFGAAFLGEVGTTMGDLTLAVLVLGALLLLVRGVSDSSESRDVMAPAVAGLLLGFAVGVKFTTGIFGLGLLLVCLLRPGSLNRRAIRGFAFSAAAGAGVVVTGGYWMYLMYRHFRSPLFPFYNRWFQSPFAPLENFNDRYRPADWASALAYPFRFLTGQGVAETQLADPRHFVAWLAIVLFVIVVSVRWFSGRMSSERPQFAAFSAVAIFFVTSYLVWLPTFGLYRYALPLEMLAGPLLIAAVKLAVGDRAEALVVSAGVCLLAIAGTQRLDYGRSPWTAEYFGIFNRQALERYDGATMLMVDMPNAYFAPFFPDSTTFVRVLGNWGLSAGQSEMWRRVQERIAQADDSRLYLLETYPTQNLAEKTEVYKQLGITVNEAACAELASLIDRGRICPVLKDRRLNREGK